jgi:hypothetical protein
MTLDSRRATEAKRSAASYITSPLLRTPSTTPSLARFSTALPVGQKRRELR